MFSRAKFAERLSQTHFSAAFLLARYTQLATLITPAEGTVPALRDPKDQHVLACALGARAAAVVSGDADLLSLGSYENIPIITAAQCLLKIGR